MTKTDPHWLRLELLTPTPDRDAARLAAFGALGVEVHDASTFMEGVEEVAIPAGKARLIAYFDDDRPLDELRRKIEAATDEAELMSIAEYRDRSWETAWMDYFKATALSPRVTVGPPWDEPSGPEDGVALVIEPGMAFGTGTHETTRLCARLLDDLLRQRTARSLLDVGCGSAILSMLASGLGVQRVVGIDVDATAVEVARANIETNGFSPDQIELSTTALSSIDEDFDVVVANILAHILVDLRDHLLDITAPGGDLVLSGIAEDQADQVRNAFNDPRFSVIDQQSEEEWIALHLRRKNRNSS